MIALGRIETVADVSQSLSEGEELGFVAEPEAITSCHRRCQSRLPCVAERQPLHVPKGDFLPWIFRGCSTSASVLTASTIRSPPRSSPRSAAWESSAWRAGTASRRQEIASAVGASRVRRPNQLSWPGKTGQKEGPCRDLLYWA